MCVTLLLEGSDPCADIDEELQICCDGVVVDRPDNAECCLEQAYDSMTNMCCNGVVQEKRDECCNTTSYDEVTR